MPASGCLATASLNSAYVMAHLCTMIDACIQSDYNLGVIYQGIQVPREI